MKLPFDLLIMQADRTAIHSECTLMEANSSINNVKHRHSPSKPVASLCTQNKMNGTADETRQSAFQYRMKKTLDLP